MIQKILISQCLLGDPVRYDGKSKALHNKLFEQWQQQGRLVSICPELSGGLAVPRDAAEIITGDGHLVLDNKAEVKTKAGQNVTKNFIKGAFDALDLCKKNHIKCALLTAKSPSCGNKEIYDGRFSLQMVVGEGVTAALLKQHDIAVFNQFEIEQLNEKLKSLDASFN